MTKIGLCKRLIVKFRGLSASLSGTTSSNSIGTIALAAPFLVLMIRAQDFPVGPQPDFELDTLEHDEGETGELKSPAER